MKKSTLLSFATAAAILATSAGTYAAWDSLSATTDGQVTLRKPATVAVGAQLDVFSETKTLDALPTATSTAKFTLKDIPDDTTGYEFEAKVLVKDGETIVTDDVKATVTVSGTPTKLDEEKTVTVNIAPADDATAKALAGKPLAVTVTGQVVKK